MWESTRVINCHDASFLDQELTAVYLPKGILKVANVYVVLIILMSEGYCRILVILKVANVYVVLIILMSEGYCRLLVVFLSLILYFDATRTAFIKGDKDQADKGPMENNLARGPIVLLLWSL